MQKVVVTGANGFVGSWLVKELVQNNFYVYAIIKDSYEDISVLEGIENIEIKYCELSKIKNLADIIGENDIESFFHLAWVGSGGPLRADYNVQLSNVLYSCDAATAAKKMNTKRFLCAGTVTENIVDNTLLRENVSQNMMYGIAKKTTHLMLNAYCKTIGLDFVWMQFSNVYGPNNMSGNLLSYAFSEISAGKIPEFSKGSQPYDFIYVKDLVRAIRLLATKNLKNQTYFIGSGDKCKLHQYLEKIPTIIEGSQVALGRRPEDGVIYLEEWFDISNLKEDTGFETQFKFEDGVIETYDWYKSINQIQGE